MYLFVIERKQLLRSLQDCQQKQTNKQENSSDQMRFFNSGRRSVILEDVLAGKL